MKSNDKKCSWSCSINNVNNEIVCLEDVMSEQMAVQLQLEEDINLCNDGEEAKRLNALINGEEINNIESDYELAKLLQEEFDKADTDRNIVCSEKDSLKNKKKQEDLKNVLRESFVEESFSENDSIDDEDDREWDMFVKTEKQVPLGKAGYVIEQGGKIRTKHDLNDSSKVNACRAMSMNISTGDGGGFDMKLNNNVFNSLKTYVKKERKRCARLNEKSKNSTIEGVMDEKSKLLVFKLINMGILDECNGVISTGKESNVYHGIGSNIEKNISSIEVAIKIFKTTLSEFKTRCNYIRGDFRFKDRLSKQNPRKVINLWAEKEMHNLSRIKKAGISCPDVIYFKKHVLVMSFIGENGIPSPTLREAVSLSYEQLENAKNQTIEIIRKMYDVCDLIHADLSEYNLIYHYDHIYVIDVGQSVLKGHPNAYNFLLRDCENVSKFFFSRGLIDMISGKELFDEITGEKDNEFNTRDLSRERQNNFFDEMFTKSLIERKINEVDENVSIENNCSS